MTLPYEPLQKSPSQPQRARVKLDDLDTEEFSSAFSTLQGEFKKKYGRDFRITGDDTGIHKRLHGSGRAKDVGGADLNDDEGGFIVSRGNELGLDVGDYRKNWKQIGGTGPHIHIDYSTRLRKQPTAPPATTPPVTATPPDLWGARLKIGTSVGAGQERVKVPTAVPPKKLRVRLDEVEDVAPAVWGSEGAALGEEADRLRGQYRDDPIGLRQDPAYKRATENVSSMISELKTNRHVPSVGPQTATPSGWGNQPRFNTSAGAKSALGAQRLTSESPIAVDTPQAARDYKPTPINEEVEVKAGEPFNESDLYREWYNARKSGDFDAATGLAEIYLRDYPQGKYRAAVRGNTPKLQNVDRANPASGAGAYVPVEQIEAMRKQGIKDADILKHIQDSVAGQLGLSAQETEALTQQYGQHPFYVVEPGSDARSSLDAIIKQGRSSGGLAEFNISSDVVAAIEEKKKSLRPTYEAARAAGQGLHDVPDAYFKTDAQRKANPEGWLKQLSEMDESNASALLMDIGRRRAITDEEMQAAGMSRNQLLNFASGAGGVIGPMVAYLGHAFGSEKMKQLGFESAHTSQAMGNVFGGAGVEDGETFATLGRALTGDGDALRRIRNLVVNGAGSMLAIGTAPGGAAGAGTVGALSTVGSVYAEAVDAGVDPDTAFRVSLLAAPAGMLEAFGVHSGSITKEIRKKVLGGFIKGVVKAGGKGALKEMSQEGVQQVMQNFVRKGLIDENINLMEGVGPSMLAAVILGPAAQGGGRAIGHTTGRIGELREGQRQQRALEAPAQLLADTVGSNLNQPSDIRPRLVRGGQQVAVAPGDRARVALDEVEDVPPLNNNRRTADLGTAGAVVQQLPSVPVQTDDRGFTTGPDEITPMPETRATIREQMRALRDGDRYAVVITPGTEMPRLPRGYVATETEKGVFIHDPALVSAEEVSIMVADGTHGQLLGHVEPKGPNTAAVVVAREPRTGVEQQASYVSPENVPARTAELQRQFPNTRIEVGGADTENRILQQRAMQLEQERQPQEITHYSQLQPRNEVGQFNGPPAQPRERIRVRLDEFEDVEAVAPVDPRARDYVAKLLLEKVERLARNEDGMTAPGYVAAARARLQSESAAPERVRVRVDELSPVVYHGTPHGGFEEFDLNAARETGRESGHPSAALGHWFSESKDVANDFAVPQTYASTDVAPAVYPSRLELNNPARYENHAHLNAEIKRVGGAEKLRDELQKQGHDGVVVEKSTTDNRPARRDYVAFAPEQIKSAFEFKPEVEREIASHGLPVEEVKRNVGVDRSSAPDWVKKSDRYLKDLAAGKIQNSIGVEGFIHLSRVTAYDVFKGTMNKAAWSREMTLRLKDRVKPYLDELWDYITAGKFGPEDVKKRLEQSRLVPNEIIEGIISGKRPEYVDSVINHLARQKEKVVNGAITVSDLARSYFITGASQRSDARKLEPFQAKLKEAGISIPDLAQYAEANKSGELMIRPEDAAGAWLMTENGQKALAELEAGRFNEKLWREGARVRSAFGDDRIAKLGILSAPSAGAFNMRNIGSLLGEMNAARGNPQKLAQTISKLNGVSVGKAPFLSHLLGFGSRPTVDAVAISAWLTGRGSLRGQVSREAELARSVKDFTGNKELMQSLSDRINQRVVEFRKSGVLGDDVKAEDYGAVIHQWIWNEGKHSTHAHPGMYEAMAQEPGFVAEARARLKQSLTGNRLSAGPAQAMVDEVTVLGWQTYQKTKEFFAWSSHMKATLGANISPLLGGVWQWMKDFKPSSNPNRTGVIESASSAIKSGLLTAARVIINNPISNATFQVMEEIARNPAAVADMVMGQGRRLVGLPARRTITGSNLTAITHAAREGATRGVREALQTLQRGATPAEMEKFLSSQEANTGLPPLDALINIPFRVQGAQDKLTRVYAFHRSLEGIAEVNGKNRGLKGKALKEYIEDMVFEAYEGETMRARAMNLQAAGEAEIAVFANANIASDIFSGVKEQTKKWGTAGASVQFGVDRVVPFPRSGTNVFLRGLDYTGIPILGRAPAVIGRTLRTAVDGGLLEDLKERDLKRATQTLVDGLSREDQRKVAEMIGRGITGQAIMYLGAKLGIAGLLSGFIGSSPADRGLDEAEGKRPGSLRVGKTWIDIGGTGVLGNLLVLGASIADIASNPEYDKYGEKKDWSGRAMKTAGDFVLDQPLGRPTKDIFEGYLSPEQRAQKMLGSIASQVIPGWMADIAALTDDRERNTKGQGKDFVSSTADAMGNSIKRRIPGLRSQLPEKLDALGKPVVRGIFTTESRAGDRVVDELRRLDVGIGKGRYSKNVEQRLSSVISSEAYSRAPGEKFSLDDVQAAALKEAINVARADEMASRKLRPSDAGAIVFNAKIALERDAMLEAAKDSEFWRLTPTERKRFEQSIRREWATARASLNPSKSVADEMADGREKLRDLRSSKGEIIRRAKRRAKGLEVEDR